MQDPANSGNQYFNSKVIFSSFLFAVDDANYCFIDSHVNYQKHIADGGVIQITPFYVSWCKMSFLFLFLNNYQEQENHLLKYSQLTMAFLWV